VAAGALFGAIFVVLFGMNLVENNRFVNQPPRYVLMKTDEISEATVPASSVKEQINLSDEKCYRTANITTSRRTAANIILDRFYFGENMRDAYIRNGWQKFGDEENCYQHPSVLIRVHCVPKIHVICCPRSGSTTMRRLLNTHPGALMHPTSEDRFWMKYLTKTYVLREKVRHIHLNPLDPQMLRRWLHGFESSRNYMNGSKKVTNMIWGATTPEYWFQSMPVCDFLNEWDKEDCEKWTTPPFDAIPRALRYWFPKMKFIIMARHPADRAYSHWRAFFNRRAFCKKERREGRKQRIQGCFHRYVLEFEIKWKECLRDNGEDECSVWPRREWGQGDILRGMLISFHDIHAQLWLKYFPPDQFHFVATEQVENNFEMELGMLAKYTGLDLAGFNTSIIHVNQGRDREWKMWPETRLRLEAMYRPHIQRTCQLIPQACRLVDLWYEQHRELDQGKWNCQKIRDTVNVWHEDCERRATIIA